MLSVEHIAVVKGHPFLSNSIKSTFILVRQLFGISRLAALIDIDILCLIFLKLGTVVCYILNFMRHQKKMSDWLSWSILLAKNCWPISSIKWIRKHFLQKITDATCDVGRRFLQLINLVFLELLTFSQDLSVQQLKIINFSEWCILKEMWTHHINSVHRTLHCDFRKGVHLVEFLLCLCSPTTSVLIVCKSWELKAYSSERTVGR